MSLSNNTSKSNSSAISMSKPNGHTGGSRERQGNNFGKESLRSRVATKEFKENYGAIDWSRK